MLAAGADPVGCALGHQLQQEAVGPRPRLPGVTLEPELPAAAGFCAPPASVAVVVPRSPAPVCASLLCSDQPAVERHRLAGAVRGVDPVPAEPVPREGSESKSSPNPQS